MRNNPPGEHSGTNGQAQSAELVVAVAALGGGTARTAVAVALAEAAARSGPTVLIDTDPLGLAVRWAALADQAGQALAATVVDMTAAEPGALGHGRERGASCLVIDVPASAVLPAVPAAGVLLVAVQPNRADQVASDWDAMTAAQGTRPGTYAVLTMAEPGPARRVARQILRERGIPAFTVELPRTEEITASYGHRPAGALATFGAALLAEIRSVVDR